MARMPLAATAGHRPLGVIAQSSIAALVVGATLLTSAAAGKAATPAQQNTYVIGGAVSAASTGTPASPSPASVALSVTINESHGLQPRAVKRFAWRFYGIRTDIGDHVAVCTATQIANAGNSDSGCPAGSLVGTGELGSFIYANSDPSGNAGGFACSKHVNVYNAGLHALALFVYGDPNKCGGVGALPPLPAQVTAGDGGGSDVAFELAENIVHPIAGLSFAVRSLSLNFAKSTVTVAGVPRGYMESVGCPGAPRPLNMTFTNDANTIETASTNLVACTASDAPAATTKPAITPATPHPGDAAHCSTGTWTNAPTGYAYQWLRDGTPIAQAPATSDYTVASADLGKALSCKVTATKGALSGVAVSDGVTVSPPAPTNTAAPAISPAGTVLEVGQMLTCSPGTWTNAPTSYTYRWIRPDGRLLGSGPQYTLQDSDVGEQIICEVTAHTGAGGQAAARSTAVTGSARFVVGPPDGPPRPPDAIGPGVVTTPFVTATHGDSIVTSGPGATTKKPIAKKKPGKKHKKKKHKAAKKHKHKKKRKAKRKRH